MFMYMYVIIRTIKYLCARLAATCIAIDFGSFPSMLPENQITQDFKLEGKQFSSTCMYIAHITYGSLHNAMTTDISTAHKN